MIERMSEEDLAEIESTIDETRRPMTFSLIAEVRRARAAETELRNDAERWRACAVPAEAGEWAGRLYACGTWDGLNKHARELFALRGMEMFQAFVARLCSEEARSAFEAAWSNDDEAKSEEQAYQDGLAAAAKTLGVEAKAAADTAEKRVKELEAELEPAAEKPDGREHFYNDVVEQAAPAADDPCPPFELPGNDGKPRQDARNFRAIEAELTAQRRENARRKAEATEARAMAEELALKVADLEKRLAALEVK